MHVKTDESRRGSCFAGLRPGAQAEGKARETANGRKAACLKSYRALRLKPVRILDFRRYRRSPRPGEGLLFRKEAKARAVLGLAEPVHPLPHLPRHSRLFGQHFRLHPPGGGRSILFEYRAADWNPALALRMRAMGVAPRGALMRSGQMQRLEGMRLALRASRRARMAGVVRW